jgi:hypothetical protein
MAGKQKLELTWIGKADEIKVEPRILLEDKLKGYGDSESGNMLIHGDDPLIPYDLVKEGMSAERQYPKKEYEPVTKCLGFILYSLK